MTTIESIIYNYNEGATIRMDNGVDLPAQIIGLLADTSAAYSETYDATMFIEAAWNAAHPIPKGAAIPANTPYIYRNTEGTISVCRTYETPLHSGLQSEVGEYRTITPPPEPEPWETAEYCYAAGMFFERGEEGDGPYWMGGDCCPQRYERDEMIELNPQPVTIG